MGLALVNEVTLRCERLYKSFGGTHALSNLNIEFPRQGVVAIVGPNGAGKTTLVNVVTGLLRPEGGRVLLGRSDLTRMSADQVVRLGVARTFQNLRLAFQLSVAANVMLAGPNQLGESLVGALFRYGIAKQEARNRENALKILELVGLKESCDVKAGELSYGQQKLLTLACCLATNARILILDEPVAGVDPGLRLRILALLRTLPDAGRLVIFVEHDISAVKQAADVVIVMDGGNVIATGRPADVLRRPEILETYLG